MILDIRMVHDLGVRMGKNFEMIESWLVMAQSPDDGWHFHELWSLHLPEGTEHEQDLALRELIAKRYSDGSGE